MFVEMTFMMLIHARHEYIKCLILAKYYHKTLDKMVFLCYIYWFNFEPFTSGKDVVMIKLNEMSDEDLQDLVARANQLLEQRNMKRNKVVFRLISMPDGSWIRAAKAIRNTTGLGLKIVKGIVESIPAVVPVTCDQVQSLEEALRGEGCEVEIVRG